jgi:hypothetical protein
MNYKKSKKAYPINLLNVKRDNIIFKKEPLIKFECLFNEYMNNIPITLPNIDKAIIHSLKVILK